MQRVDHLAGFVLHTRALRDTSLLVDVLTPDFGMTRLVARNARSARSRIRPLAQPFRPLLISWRGARELKTLTGLEEQGRSYALEKLGLACAYYLNELLIRLLPTEQPCATVFARYATSLDALTTIERAGASLESILRQFEMELLDSLGLLPDFADCLREPSPAPVAQAVSDCPVATQLNTDGLYDFYPDQGHAIRRDNTTADETRVFLADVSRQSRPIAVHGRTLLALNARQFGDDTTRREAKQIMRALLGIQLGEKPLKSREMLAFYLDFDKHA